MRMRMRGGGVGRGNILNAVVGRGRGI